MASKRISQSAVNWAAFAERVHPSQRLQFNTFKNKSDKYLRAVQANPESAPAIDWAKYKKNIAVAGMVDNFQKQYEALKVPYPVDKLTSEVDKQAKEVEVEIQQFIVESNKRIEEHKKELAHIASLLPFNQMTYEDFRDSYPEQALDPINRPTYWPHTPEEQPGMEPPKEEHH
ncbi:ATP synthase subunit d, mitochondrial [Culicoides brevitarsis]|uniref:ATP synthase subunit d, mitochondrial n=1 Tax=Culicoides brevitarsis TaxID=469753 RepID=UPI00307BB25E